MDYKQQQEIIKYLARLEKQLIKVYGDTYKAAIDIADVRKAIESGGTFTWSENRQAAAKLDKMLQQMTAKVETMIANGVVASYRKGERSVIGEITKALGIRTKTEKADVTAICDAATDQRRAQGQNAAAHINARRGGIQASAQIWKQNAKKEIEIIVQNGMKEGKSPSEIAQSIRGYLKEPYRYEKSVYNPTTGRLERSEAAKDYHPGQGVYRSSYKNALRMARTEMTQAYRQAEWESYQNNPLIKAYEIRLSGNHTTMKTVKGKRVPVPLTDICDKLAGVYPKTFKWVGWHPQCRCLMIPITVSKSEFRELLEARKDDREARKAGKEATAVAKINQRAANVQMPKNFTDWLTANQGRIDMARQSGGSIPMWITDNTTMPATITSVTATSTVSTPTTTTTIISDAPHPAMKAAYSTFTEIENTMKAINSEFAAGEKWFENGDLKLEIERNKNNNGSTTRNGRIWLTSERLLQVRNAMGKIGSGASSTITTDEADAMATFWHEITHNRHTIVGDTAGGNLSHSRRFMEMANEWVARHTLDTFYRKLGCAKTPHPEFMTGRASTGYDRMVVNYDYIIDTLNLRRGKVFDVVKTHLFTKDYSTQLKGLTEGLKAGGIRKLDGSLMKERELKELLKVCEEYHKDSVEIWLKAHGLIH